MDGEIKANNAKWDPKYEGEYTAVEDSREA